MTFEEELSKNIRRARQQCGYNQADFAQKIGLSTSCISMYEHGKRMPNLKIISLISHVLNVSLDDLVPYVPSYKNVIDEKQTNIYDLIGE